MRTFAFLLLTCPLVFADVVVLKDGAKVAGRVKEKESYVEITTDAGLRTYLKDEVDRIVTSPDEFVGDADKLYEGAKQDYLKGAELDDNPAQQNAILKEAIEKLNKAREQVSTARELFPETKYSNLDQKLIHIMMLMRMVRSRVTSERIIPRAPVTAPKPEPPKPEPPKPEVPPDPFAPLRDAFETLLDTAKRKDPAARSAAHDTLRERRASYFDLHDVITAGMLFLSRPEDAWKLEGEDLKALEDYFDKPWLKDLSKLTPETHLEAAIYLSKSKMSPALSLFALGHLAHAKKGEERDKCAKAAGFEVAHGRVGTVEGLAVADLNNWINSGDYFLAMTAYAKEHKKKADTPSVRLLNAWAVLNRTLKKREKFDLAMKAFAALRVPDPKANMLFSGIARAIKDKSPCRWCKGDGWLRCTNCHGMKEIFVICKYCQGKRARKNKTGSYIFCNPCKATGYAARLVCRKCKSGYFDCRVCKLPKCGTCSSSGRVVCTGCNGQRAHGASFCKTCGGAGYDITSMGEGAVYDLSTLQCQTCSGTGRAQAQDCAQCLNGFVDCTACAPLRQPPSLENIVNMTICGGCEGRGTIFRNAEWTCKQCMGLGLELAVRRAD